jgi:hypothetical protein
LPRPDIRGFSSQAGYQFRPEGKFLIAWGPMMEANSVWDHAGNHLNALFMGQMSAELIGKTYLSVGFAPEFELFRPQDYPVLKANQGYHRHTTLVSFSTSYLRQISVEGEFRFGLRINVDPIAGQPPELARRDSGNITLTFRPRTSLRIDNTYLLFRLQNRYDDSSIFNNHILRSKWNWQFNRELSLRLILQYDALLANSAQTSLPTTKSFNADFLITYLLRPGTALYLGYNSNLRNVDLLPCGPASSCTRKLVNGEEFRNDAKGLFVKLSYLFRF